MNAIQTLRQQLPNFSDQHCRLLAGRAITSRRDLEELVLSHIDIRQSLAELLGMDLEDLRRALGWIVWPERRGVELGMRLPVAGVIAPEAHREGLARRQHLPMNARPTTLDTHACLAHRYQPPRNQGLFGACTAFGLVGVIEGQTQPSTDQAEAYLYSRTKAIDIYPDTDGSSLRFALEALLRGGICLESTWPYREDRQYLRSEPSPTACAEAEAFRPRLSQPLELFANSPVDLQIAIQQGLPVALSVPLFQSSIHSLLFHGQGRLLMRLGDGDAIHGFHAMCAVGFFENSWLTSHQIAEQPGGGAFLVRNSWGADWARENPLSRVMGLSGGYALMPFAYVQEYCFEAVTVTVTANPPTKLLAAIGSVWNQRKSDWKQTVSLLATTAHARLKAGLYSKDSIEESLR